MKERVAWPGGEVTAVRHEPRRPTRLPAVVLAHGAGGSLDTPLLVSFCDALAENGVAACRFNLPYAERGRRTPGSPREAIGCVDGVARWAVEETGRPAVIGGKSYGGRMASHAVAQGAPAAGLLFLGYPLHAPGRPDAVRDEHLGGIPLPMLFLQGTRDAFARADRLQISLARLPSVSLHSVEGGDHSFAVSGRKASEVLEGLVAATLRWMRDFGRVGIR